MEPIKKSSCCTPQETAENAAKAMKHSGCGCTPVVEDKENFNLVGVVTERDICHSVAADNRLASDVSVEEIMRPASSCCGEDESLEDAKQKLVEHQATSLPVVNKAGSCCGTISSQDIG
jgi:CBS domain-containing protein